MHNNSSQYGQNSFFFIYYVKNKLIDISLSLPSVKELMASKSKKSSKKKEKKSRNLFDYSQLED